MTRAGENYALQVIFSFFLGLMVLAFIGIGVNTFYPSPRTKYDDELQKLYREQEAANVGSDRTPTPADKAASLRTQKQIDEIVEKQEAETKVWARNTSIVVILFATAVMAISLIRSEQLRVVSNGLLMGGLFTMVYGVGWVLFSGESIARFFVILFAFVVTLALGYVKFVRGREERAVQMTAPPVPGAGVPALDSGAWSDVMARLDRLEARTAAAAAALGSESGSAVPRDMRPDEPDTKRARADSPSDV